MGSDHRNILHPLLLWFPHDETHRIVLGMITTFLFHMNTMHSRFPDLPYDCRWLLVIGYLADTFQNKLT